MNKLFVLFVKGVFDTLILCFAVAAAIIIPICILLDIKLSIPFFLLVFNIIIGLHFLIVGIVYNLTKNIGKGL